MDNPGFTSIQLDGREVGRQAERLSDKYDDVIIDTGGRDTTSQRSALTVSDLLLAPFTPRSPDIWTLDDVEDIVETIRTVNPDLQAYAFLNQADHQGRYNQEAEDILDESECLQYLSAYLGRRKSFGIAFDRGQGVIEYRPKDNKAIDEMRALYDTVFDLETDGTMMPSLQRHQSDLKTTSYLCQHAVSLRPTRPISMLLSTREALSRKKRKSPVMRKRRPPFAFPKSYWTASTRQLMSRCLISHATSG